jgi:hypothetical protein
MKRAVVLTVLVMATHLALGQPADALKQAQAAFDQAQVDYLAGKFDDAAKGFETAYNARQFSQFLFNVGACYHMKGKKAADVESYTKAIDYYKRYLAAEKTAPDKAKVEKAIAVLEAEIARLKPQPGATPPTAPATPPQEVPDAKVRGLVVIESEPQNATIYLDDPKKGPFASTPWSGSLEGDHKVIIEKRGFMVSESTIAASPDKLFVLRAVLGKEDFLGWIEITSNIVGAEIYIDDKAVGSVAKTPHSKNIKPGKHTIWVTSDGYDEYKEEIEVTPGGTHEIKAMLKGTPVGKLDVRGVGIEEATISVDGNVLCERGPCLKSLQEGEHTITVTQPGMKPYSSRVLIRAKAQTTVKVTLQPTPGRGDAIVTGAIAAGFLGGGIILGLQANKYRDDLKAGVAPSTDAPIDTNDPRFTKGKIFAIAADTTFVIAGFVALTSVYYAFREKGSPSSALIEVSSLALQPQVGPGYAGLGMEVHW